MKKIHLYGSIAKYGEVFELDVETAGEAIMALHVNFPGFLEDIRDDSWILMRGDRETGLSLDEEAIVGMKLGDADLHIMPAVMGSKNSSGLIKIVVGMVLIAAVVFSGGTLAAPIAGGALGGMTAAGALTQIGIALILAGVASVLAPEEESQGQDEDSFTLTGPTSRTGQGQAIQIVYGGPIITGGMLISGGIDADGLESVEVNKPKPAVPDPNAVRPDVGGNFSGESAGFGGSSGSGFGGDSNGGASPGQGEGANGAF